jgi:segregation and condensation protein A
VATVCDQFHEYLRLMEELNLDIAAEYIYEAALLIHLKSKMLLPRPTRVEGEEEEDPRADLVRRLMEYRRLKEAAQTLGEIHGLRRGIRTRPPATLPSDVGDAAEIDLGDISLFDLLGALRETLQRYDREHPPPLHLTGQSFSVRGQLDRLLEALKTGRPLDLVRELRSRSCRAEVVAAFLAVLELARLHLVRLHQTEGGELLLYRTEREAEEHELEAIQS